MVNHLCSFRNPRPWINFALLTIIPVVPLIILVGFLGFGYFFFSIFLTSTILILSTIFFTFSKPKPVEYVIQNTISEKDDHVLISPDINQKIQVPHLEDHVKESHEHENNNAMIVSHSIISSHNSPDSLSELSECLDHSSTTEDSEVEWPFRDNAISTGAQKIAGFSNNDDDDDESISDEESLIEISLPSGHYVGLDNQDHFNLNQKRMAADLFPECIFKPRSLMDLLAEINDMNEEENLIEIDISMGSIKCSRFEIEA